MLDRLSEQERRVAIMVALGLNNSEIARRMEIKMESVEKYTSRIYALLELKNLWGNSRVLLALAVLQEIGCEVFVIDS